VILNDIALVTDKPGGVGRALVARRNAPVVAVAGGFTAVRPPAQ